VLAPFIDGGTCSSHVLNLVHYILHSFAVILFMADATETSGEYDFQNILYDCICTAVYIANRCRMLCCCATADRQTANAFEDVAFLISDYFHVCFFTSLR